MKPVNIGIIGCGQIAIKAHIPNLNTIPDVKTIALCDQSEISLNRADALCLESDLKLYNNVDDLLASSEVDAVIIAVPNNLHAKMAIKAMEAGKAVFLEKPLTTTLTDANMVIEKVSSSGSILQVGYEFHYSDIISQAKKFVKEGLIGDIKLMNVREIRFPLRPGWRNKISQSGGVMLEKNSHYLQLFNEFAESQPNMVFGMGDRALNFETELIDNCIVTIGYPEGIKASLFMCLMDPYKEHYDFEIIGTRGRLFIDLLNLSIEYFLFNDNINARIEIRPTAGREDAMHTGTRSEMIAFIESVRSGNRPEIDAVETARIVSLSLSIEKSIRYSSVEKVSRIDRVN